MDGLSENECHQNCSRAHVHEEQSNESPTVTVPPVPLDTDHRGLEPDNQHEERQHYDMDHFGRVPKLELTEVEDGERPFVLYDILHHFHMLREADYSVNKRR